jgi:hypothetical protein
MVEIYRVRSKTLVIRTTAGIEIVTVLRSNGAEKRSPYRPDVVRSLGELLVPIGKAMDFALRSRDNGVLPRKPVSAALGS